MTEQRLFLWDIDGTLLRGAANVHRDAFAHAFNTVYDLPLSLNDIHTPGRTDTWLLLEALRRHGVEDGEARRHMPEAFRIMEQYVTDHPQNLRSRVLPGVQGVLDGLRRRGHVLGLLTGNLRGIAMEKMRQAGLASYFAVGGFGEESATRSHLVAVALHDAGSNLGRRVEAEEVVIVGDTPLDVEAARLAGTRSVAVATGQYSSEQLREAQADTVLESLADVQASVDALTSVEYLTRR